MMGRNIVAKSSWKINKRVTSHEINVSLQFFTLEQLDFSKCTLISPFIM